jgi:hypothetical protein
MMRMLAPALAMLLAAMVPSLSAGADLAVSLRDQIVRCWNPMDDASHIEQVVVRFRVFLNRDGTIAQPPQLSARPEAPDGEGSFAVAAARRAIYSCAPYRLPEDRYGEWHDAVITFDPRLMGQ